MPIAASKTIIGPRVGFKNHLVALIRYRKIEFATKTPLKINSTLFREPLNIAVQKKPTAILATMIAGRDI